MTKLTQKRTKPTLTFDEALSLFKRKLD